MFIKQLVCDKHLLTCSVARVTLQVGCYLFPFYRLKLRGARMWPAQTQDLSDVTQTSRTCSPHLSLGPMSCSHIYQFHGEQNQSFPGTVVLCHYWPNTKWFWGISEAELLLCPGSWFWKYQSIWSRPLWVTWIYFMLQGFGWAFTSLGIAQKQRTWSCLLWASLTLLHWSFGVSAHFSRQTPSRQRLATSRPHPHLSSRHFGPDIKALSALSRHLGKVQEETLCRFEVEELESAPLAPTWPS